MIENEAAQNQIILILKDSDKDLSQLLNSLQLAQYIILVAQNQQNYISIIESTKPNLVILDYLMLGADSLKVCQTLRNNSLDIPLVLINSSPEVAHQVTQLGWKKVDCIAQTSEPEKIVYLIKNRLSIKQYQPVYSSAAQGNNLLSSTHSNNQQTSTFDHSLLNKNNDLDNFASIVSHDLQAPLRSLTMFAELLMQEYQANLDLKGQEYLERISNSSSRMQALIENLRLYSHAGKNEQTWIMVDLNQICHQVQENLQFEISQTYAEIVVRDLPEILINPTEISQVLQNLLENALKFHGDQAPHIEIYATEKAQEWLISVRDNGIGIAEQDQAKIFQVFYRLDSTQTNSGGGIGLSICQKIVESYGGTIGVESAVGKGSIFYFSLPKNINPHISC